MITDSTETFVAAAVELSMFFGDVASAEAEAAIWGLQVAKNSRPSFIDCRN